MTHVCFSLAGMHSPVISFSVAKHEEAVQSLGPAQNNGVRIQISDRHHAKPHCYPHHFPDTPTARLGGHSLPGGQTAGAHSPPSRWVEPTDEACRARCLTAGARRGDV